MAYLLDTNIAIHLRDGDPGTKAALGRLRHRPGLSIITRVELEGGVYARPEYREKRRRAVDALIRRLGTIDFDAACAEAYGRIVASAGFSRRKINDRMIAATALVHDLTLITIDGDDFRDVPGLKLEVWG